MATEKKSSLWPIITVLIAGLVFLGYRIYIVTVETVPEVESKPTPPQTLPAWVVDDLVAIEKNVLSGRCEKAIELSDAYTNRLSQNGIHPPPTVFGWHAYYRALAFYKQRRISFPPAQQLEAEKALERLFESVKKGGTYRNLELLIKGQILQIELIIAKRTRNMNKILKGHYHVLRDEWLKEFDSPEIQLELAEAKALEELYWTRLGKRDRAISAMKIANRAVALAKQQGNPLTIARMRQLYANTLTELVEIDDSMEIWNEARKEFVSLMAEFSEKENPTDFASVRLDAAPLWLYAAEKWEDGEAARQIYTILKEALLAIDYVHHTKGYIEASMDLGRACLALGKLTGDSFYFEEALGAYNSVLELITIESDTILFRDIHRKLAEVYREIAAYRNKEQLQEEAGISEDIAKIQISSPQQ